MAKSDPIIETVAGNRDVVDNCPANSAGIYDPAGLAVDDVGNLYIGDRESGIRKVDAFTGNISTVASIGTGAFDGAEGMALDGAGNLYIANGRDCIRKIDASTGNISIVAGTESWPLDAGFGGDGGPAISAMLNYPDDVALDTAGNLYIADSHNDCIRKVDASTGTISTVAGAAPKRESGELEQGERVSSRGSTHVLEAMAAQALAEKKAPLRNRGSTRGFGGDGGPATSAMLQSPLSVALDAADNLYIADFGNHRIRKVDALTGNISTVAGTGKRGFDGDGGPAALAKLHSPRGIALDGAGNLYIADAENHRIRKVGASNGNISTVAGTGSAGFSGDGGPAAAATFRYPWRVACDSAGNLYVVDINCGIRKVDASTGHISTVAGRGLGDGGPAVAAMFEGPQRLALDSDGNLYIADSDNSTIRKIDASTGNISTVAGSGVEGFGGDGGPAVAAMLNRPAGVALDRAGNLLISDKGNHRIRKVDVSTGNISTVAGTGTGGVGGDGGPATSAKLNSPSGIALDGIDNLYIADSENHRVRKVTAFTGTISTVAGTKGRGFSGDGGKATVAKLDEPTGLALDAAGNLYIAELGNGRVRKVDASTRHISTVVGPRPEDPDGDGGPATSAMLNVSGIALDGADNLFIAGADSHCVRKVDASTGNISTIAGAGGYSQRHEGGFGGDGGPAVSAMLHSPEGVALEAAGNLYIADRFNHRIRKVDAATGNILTIAGMGNAGFGGDGDTATAAMLDHPEGLALDAANNLYVADSGNHRIRKVDASTGNISTIAGTGKRGFGGNGGPARSALLNSPEGVALDAAGNLYLSDTGNHCIRKVDVSTGNILTVAGTGECGFGGDGGPAASAMLNEPNGIALDGAGNLYIADSGNTRIRKMDASTGNISTVAGIGMPGFAGDDGPAIAAMLNDPKGVALDDAGNLYIADAGHDKPYVSLGNHRIRKVDASTGTISTVAGVGLGDGGPATSLPFVSPTDVAVDDAGNLYVADQFNQRIRKVDASTGNISTIAGTGREGFGGDGGPASRAVLFEPQGLAVDGAGDLYFADSGNHRIRRVRTGDGRTS